MWRMGLLVHRVRIEPSGSRLPIGIYWILMTYTFRRKDKCLILIRNTYVIRCPRHRLERDLLSRNSSRGRLVWMGGMGGKSRTSRNRWATGSTRARHGSRRGTSAIRHSTREGR